MYLISIFAPIISCFFALLFGRWVDRRGVSIITISGMFASFSVSLVALYEVSFCFEKCEIFLFNWIYIGSIKLDFGFLFDTLTALMIMVICFISLLIHTYSVKYMEFDPFKNRYMAFLSFFTFCMLILVTADNFVQMFVGWEGVGISSYLLISFWYTRILANKAALKAMLINRIGDICLLIGLSALLLFFGTLNYSIVDGVSNYIFLQTFYSVVFNYSIIDFICLFLFFGAMGKSAQLFLHVWLPDAMEGPTPVSALIHAATMVTAGVFLVVRCSFLFEFSESVLLFIVLVGSLTCFFMGLIGVYQNDIKKIVAYSTCSQLGYMFFACGLSNYYVSMFHLFNHAFFKALLFLSMGSIIHAVSDEQDLRKMGGLLIFLPITAVCVFIGTVALLGIPFFAGYYSKDVLLEISFMRHNFDGFFSYVLGIFAVFCTAFYSTRLFYRVFVSHPTLNFTILRSVHESEFLMLIPMLLLAILSIFIGYLFSEAFLGFGSQFFGDSIFISTLHYNMLDVEFGLSKIVKIIPLIVTILGVVVYVRVYDINLFLKPWYRFCVMFFSKSMLFDNVYSNGIMYNFLVFSYKQYYRYVEFGIFQLLFIENLRRKSFKLFKQANIFTSGKFYLYIVFSLLGLTYLIFSVSAMFFFNLPVMGTALLIIFCFILRPFIGWNLNKKKNGLNIIVGTTYNILWRSKDTESFDTNSRSNLI